MSFTIGSLFDGSGGFPLAGFLCGGVPVWASEIEPYPIAVTKSRFPYVKHLGSVTDIKGDEIEPVDVITFGSPCQDLSVAGKRAGLKHEDNGDDETTRSGLFIEAVRIIKEMREATNGEYPRFALWENVPGAFSSNKGEDFKVVLEELIKIVEPTAVMPDVPKKGWAYADCYRGNGWSIAYRTLDSQYWGVPQRRRRIYLVADFRGERAGEILFKRDGLRGYFAESGSPWKTAPGDITSGVGAADCPTNSVNVLTPWDSQGNQVYDGTDNHVYPCLRGCGGAGYQQGYVFAPSYSVQDRAGKPGGGKGMLVQENRATSLRTSNYQYIFQPIIDSNILDDQSGSVMNVRTDGKAPTLRAMMGGHPPVVLNPVCVMASSAVNAEITDGTISPCLMARAGTGGNQLPLVACYDARGNGDGNICPTITGDHNNRVTDYTSVCVEPVYCLQGNGIDRADTASCNGKGWKEDTCYTLNTVDRPAVAYLASGKDAVGTLMASMATKQCLGDQEAFSGDYHIIEEKYEIYRQGGFADYIEGEAGTVRASGGDLGGGSENLVVSYGFDQSAVRDMGKLFIEECSKTLTNGTAPGHHNGVVISYYKQPVQYIVRRLTPTECARLQGFPDCWGHPDRKDDFTDEEYSFWLNVRNTHAEINGKQTKDYTKAQMLTWYNKLHTDSAEYKMWGNGIALPTALYVMEGISDVYTSV